MRTVLTALLSAAGISGAHAQAVDWRMQLSRSPAEISAALGEVAECGSAPHSVEVGSISVVTDLRDDLLDPVYDDIMSQHGDDRSSSDAIKRHTSSRISVQNCTVGKEATVRSYSLDDRVFRIVLTFDRCKDRGERNLTIGFTDTGIKGTFCDGADIGQKPFDVSIYEGIAARKTYGYNGQGQPGAFDFRWNRFMRNEFGDYERSLVYVATCDPREEVNREIRISGLRYRCLVDVENDDPSRWSGTAMFELLQPGGLFDSVDRRLTVKRVFVNIPTELEAISSMRGELKPLIDGVKAELIRRRDADKAKDDAVSGMLGGSN